MLTTGWNEIHRIVLGGIVTEFAFVMIVARFANAAGLLINESLYLTVFLFGFIAAILLWRKSRPSVTINLSETSFLILIVVSVLILLRVTFPSSLPGGYGVDAAAHYSVAYSILRTGRLNSLAPWFSQVTPGLQSYPWGYHVVVVFLSEDVKLPLILNLHSANSSLDW
jgi:hypothetical protein